jgi:hypothetical protein
MKLTLPTRREIRHANLGIVTAAIVLLVGVIVFKDSGDGALEIVGLSAFVVALVVSHTLNAISDRRERREGHK